MICSLQSSSPTFVGHVSNPWVMNCLYRVFSTELDSVPGRLCPPPGGSPAALGRDRALERCRVCVSASHFCRGYNKLHWELRKSGWTWAPLCPWLFILWTPGVLPDLWTHSRFAFHSSWLHPAQSCSSPSPLRRALDRNQEVRAGLAALKGQLA